MIILIIISTAILVCLILLYTSDCQISFLAFLLEEEDKVYSLYDNMSKDYMAILDKLIVEMDEAIELADYTYFDTKKHLFEEENLKLSALLNAWEIYFENKMKLLNTYSHKYKCIISNKYVEEYNKFTQDFINNIK